MVTFFIFAGLVAAFNKEVGYAILFFGISFITLVVKLVKAKLSNDGDY